MDETGFKTFDAVRAYQIRIQSIKLHQIDAGAGENGVNFFYLREGLRL